MKYRFTSADTSYEDFASGAVLRSAPGFPGFPIRLASELFSVAFEDLGGRSPITLYDPFCGSGQLLTSLGFLHNEAISHIIGSDIDPIAMKLAEQNLALLTDAGLSERKAALRELYAEHGKPSHERTIQAALRLGSLSNANLATTVAAADALDANQMTNSLDGARPDLVISDLPYGQQTNWSGDDSRPVDTLLGVLRQTLPHESIVVLVGHGRRLPGGTGLSYRTFRIGKRIACFYRVTKLTAPNLSGLGAPDSP